MSVSLKRLFDKLGQGASSAELLHEWVATLYRNRADLAGTNLFSEVSSENLQRLYALLDSPVRSVRQSAMVIFALVFLSPLAKAMFLLKFGLSVKPGKIMISRLKIFKSEVDAVELLATLGEPLNWPVGGLLWYVPVMMRDYSRALKPFEFFRDSALCTGNSGSVDVLMVPDPLTNICGVEFSPEDFEIARSQLGASGLSADADSSFLRQPLRLSKNDQKPCEPSFEGEPEKNTCEASALPIQRRPTTTSTKSPSKPPPKKISPAPFKPKTSLTLPLSSKELPQPRPASSKSPNQPRFSGFFPETSPSLKKPDPNPKAVGFKALNRPIFQSAIATVRTLPERSTPRQ